jgi:hypothetical protein
MIFLRRKSLLAQRRTCGGGIRDLNCNAAFMSDDEIYNSHLIMTLPKFTLFATILCSAAALSGCSAIVAVGDAAITVGATAVKIGAKAVGAVADAVIPDGDKKKEDK